MLRPINGLSHRNDLTVYISRVHDFDNFYTPDDYRTLMSSLSPTSKVSFNFFANLPKVSTTLITHSVMGASLPISHKNSGNFMHFMVTTRPSTITHAHVGCGVL